MDTKRALDIKKENEEVLRRPFKKMDLSNIFHHDSFSCKNFEFGSTHELENIRSHGSNNPKEVKHKHEEVKNILLEGLETTTKKKVFLTVVLYIFI